MCVSRHGCRSYLAVRHCFVPHDSKLCISSVRVKFTIRQIVPCIPLYSIPFHISSVESIKRPIYLITRPFFIGSKAPHAFLHPPTPRPFPFPERNGSCISFFHTSPSFLDCTSRTCRLSQNSFHRPYGILYCTHVCYFLSASSYCNARIDKIVSLGLLVGYYSCVYIALKYENQEIERTWYIKPKQALVGKWIAKGFAVDKIRPQKGISRIANWRISSLKLHGI